MLGIKLLLQGLPEDSQERLPCLHIVAEAFSSGTEEEEDQEAVSKSKSEQSVEVPWDQQNTPAPQQKSNNNNRGVTEYNTGGSSPVVINPASVALIQANTTAEKAYALVQSANKLLDGGLHRCKEWGEVKDQYFNAGALFAESDMHVEAAEAFNSSAAICRIYGDPLEVANAISFAIDSSKICDPVMASSLLQEQANILKNSGRDLRAAKCMRDLAQISEQLGLDDEAIKQFKEAITLFGTSDNTIGLRRPCAVRVAHLTAQTGRYIEAVPLFEALAANCVAPIAPTVFYFKAVLCLFADAGGERYAGGIAKGKNKFLDYQDLDPLLQKGVENQLIRDIIFAFDKPSLANMDVAFYKYRDMRTGGNPSDGKESADEWFEETGAKIRDNLFQYLLPFM